jgi:hypothetical protein
MIHATTPSIIGCAMKLLSNGVALIIEVYEFSVLRNCCRRATVRTCSLLEFVSYG